MIENEGKYYLYRHIRLDTGEPFYIGIGTKNKKKSSTIRTTYYRAHTYSKRNNFWKNIITKTEYEVEILLESNDYEFIKQKEIEFIALYGRRDLNKGTLVNMTDGGDGMIGVIQSLETIEKRRLRLKGRKLKGKALESAKNNGKEKLIKNRERLVGTKYQMNQGFWAVIIEYNGTQNVLIEFLHTSERRVCAMTEIRKGAVRDYSELSSETGFKGSRGIGGDKMETNRWKKFIKKNINSYGISREWLNFYSFNSWYESYKKDNFNLKTHLFGEEGACDSTNTYFLPINIIQLLKPSKGYYIPERGRVRMRIRGYNPKGFDSKEEAIEAFKEVKKEIIKMEADKYKDYFSEELYDKIINSEIKIIE